MSDPVGPSHETGPHTDHTPGVLEHAKQEAAGGPAAVSRRTFLFKVGIALNGLVGLAIAAPIVRYLLGPVRKSGAYDAWIPLGKLAEYPDGKTTIATYRNPSSHGWDGETANVACYVKNEGGGKFVVFAVNCAHLGCPVRWFPQSELFMCPCHGGVYYADGSRAAGPPERGLFKYEYRVKGDTLMIHAGQTPTLSNEAKLVKGIIPCPGTNKPTIG